MEDAFYRGGTDTARLSSGPARQLVFDRAELRRF